MKYALATNQRLFVDYWWMIRKWHIDCGLFYALVFILLPQYFFFSIQLEQTFCHSGVFSFLLQVLPELWDNQKQECTLINSLHLIYQLSLLKVTTLKILQKSCVTNLRNSGKFLQGKQEQLGSDRGVPLSYILIAVVLNTPPRLHLAHIFPCGATLLRIQTYSEYFTVFQESPSP